MTAIRLLSETFSRISEVNAMYIGDKWYSESEVAALAYELTALLEEAMQIIKSGIYLNYEYYERVNDLMEKIKALP